MEITTATSETSRAWALPTGEIRQEISTGPVRVRQGDAWAPVDLTLEQQPDGSVVPKAHPDALTLSGTTTEAGVHELATLGTGAEQVTMGWTGPLPVPTLAGNKATYAEVKPGIDLVVEATVTGVESFYVVKNRAAAAQVSDIAVPIAGQDVASHRLTADGGLTLLDGDKKAMAYSPTPLMWDARTDPVTGQPTQVRVMDSEAATRPATDTSAAAESIEGVGVNLEITPDAGFLADPHTVYPVTIDPALTLGDPTWDTWVREGDDYDHSLTGFNQIGAFSGHVARSFVNFDVSAFKGKQITDATIGLYNSDSNSCTNVNWEIWTVNGSSTATRWTNQPAWKTKEATSSATKAGPNACTAAGMIYVNGVNFFQRQATELRNIGYMGIRATDETNPAAAKNFYSQNYTDTSKSPYAIVTYQDYPATAPALIDRKLTPGSNCVVGAGRPTINTMTPTAEASYDSPTSTMNVTFEWWRIDGTAPLTSATVTTENENDVAQAEAPSGYISTGNAYKWRVKAASGTSVSTWSNWCEFNVDTTGPGISSLDYPEGATAGPAGTAGAFSLSPPSSTPAQLTSYIYWLDQGAQVEATADAGGAPITVSITPATSGPHTLYARARFAGSIQSTSVAYTFNVDSTGLPEVTVAAAVADGEVLESAIGGDFNQSLQGGQAAGDANASGIKYSPAGCRGQVNAPHPSTHVKQTVNVTSTGKCLIPVPKLNQHTVLWRLSSFGWKRVGDSGVKTKTGAKTLQTNASSPKCWGVVATYSATSTHMSWEDAKGYYWYGEARKSNVPCVKP